MTGTVAHLEISKEEPFKPAKPLRETVAQALCEYLEKLDGHAPDDLYRLVLEEVERPLLETVMDYCGGNQTKAAIYLGLNRGTLRKKLKQYDIS